MPESVFLLLFAVLVVVAVALFKRFAIPVTGIGALAVTIIACVIFAAIEAYVIGGSVLGFVVSAIVIYAIANVIFQLVTKLRGAE